MVVKQGIDLAAPPLGSVQGFAMTFSGARGRHIGKTILRVMASASGTEQQLRQLPLLCSWFCAFGIMLMGSPIDGNARI